MSEEEDEQIGTRERLSGKLSIETCGKKFASSKSFDPMQMPM
jgi:hypothetical protein